MDDRSSQNFLPAEGHVRGTRFIGNGRSPKGKRRTELEESEDAAHCGKKNNCGINEFVKHFMIGEFGKLCDDKDEQSCVLESF